MPIVFFLNVIEEEKMEKRGKKSDGGMRGEGGGRGRRGMGRREKNYFLTLNATGFCLTVYENTV